MCNKIKILNTYATALIYVPPCICIVNGSHMDVSTGW
jgi:hypothetical protein